MVKFAVVLCVFLLSVYTSSVSANTLPPPKAAHVQTESITERFCSGMDKLNANKAENVCIRIRWGDAEGLFLEPVSFKPPSDTAAVKPEGSKWSLFTSLVYGVQYTGGNLFELGMHGIKVVKYGKAIYAIYDQKALLTYQGFFSIGVFIWNFVEIYKHSIHAMNYQTDHEFSEAELVIVSASSAFEFYYESPEIMDTLYNVLGYSGKGIKVSDWLNIISYSLIFRNLYETISGISASSINWWATWIGQDSGEIEPESFPP